MKENYAKAYKEIVEILKYVPKEDVEKIPIEMRELFEEKMDKSYEFTIDINKDFEEQEILDETKAILFNIFRDYWATSNQKEKIIAKQNYDRQILEQQKREKYNPDNIFNKEDKTQENYNLPIEIKKEKFYEKIINFIKKVFKL